MRDIKKQAETIIVSNRLPVTVKRDEGGKLYCIASGGGLATAMEGFKDRLWIGWPGIVAENRKEEEVIAKMLRKHKCVPVFLTEEEVRKFYYGACNRLLWSLFHSLLDKTDFRESMEVYVEVNEKFAAVLKNTVTKDSLVWVHDYQLLYLAKALRAVSGAECGIGFFLHIPFPSDDILSRMPQCKELLEWLLEYDLIGFQDNRDVRHYLESTRSELNVTESGGKITTIDGKMTQALCLPIGLDVEKFQTFKKSRSVCAFAREIRRNAVKRKIIAAVSRMDYTKGIPELLAAFELFLKDNPEQRDAVILVLVASPSRMEIEEYQNLRKEVEREVGRINGLYGTLGKMPIWYYYQDFPQKDLAALYAESDVGIITPLKDGMNLVALEYVICQKSGREGVVIASRHMGAASVLMEALRVNPNDIGEVARAMKEALAMPKDTARSKMEAMQNRVAENTVQKWATDFLRFLRQTKEDEKRRAGRPLTLGRNRRSVCLAYAGASARLVILDQDGTVLEFANRPEDVAPDDELRGTIAALARNPRNTVVILSGRPKKTLMSWYGDLNVHLYAEHGAWRRKPRAEWVEMVIPSDWMPRIQEVMERCAARLSGVWVEKKDYALTLHYRAAEVPRTDLESHLCEIKRELSGQITGTPLVIIQGNMAIEVTHSLGTKAEAVAHLLAKESPEFTLYLGDDGGDERAFERFPEHCSVKVGSGPTAARYTLPNPAAARVFLRELAEE